MRFALIVAFACLLAVPARSDLREQVAKQLGQSRALAGAYVLSGTTTVTSINRSQAKNGSAHTETKSETWIAQGDLLLRFPMGANGYTMLWNGSQGIIRQATGSIFVYRRELIEGPVPTALDMGYRVGFFATPEHPQHADWLNDAVDHHPPAAYVKRPNGKIGIVWHFTGPQGVRSVLVEIDPSKSSMIDQIEWSGAKAPTDGIRVVEAQNVRDFWLPTKVVSYSQAGQSGDYVASVQSLRERPDTSFLTILLKPGEVVTDPRTGAQFEMTNDGRLESNAGFKHMKRAWQMVGAVIAVLVLAVLVAKRLAKR